MQKAFSLVELSVVLTVIGLIVAGVLVGQNMLENSRARGNIVVFQDIQSGANIFSDQFASYPGDLAEATTLLDSSVQDGDGNGVVHNRAGTVIDDATIGVSIADGSNGVNEYASFFHHLSVTNMINASYDGTKSDITLNKNFPALKTELGGLFVVGMPDQRNYVYMGILESANANFTYDNVLTPAEAYVIDSKLDDGKPITGVVKARDENVFQAPFKDNSFDNASCVDGANIPTFNPESKYKIHIDERVCSLLIYAFGE